MQELDIRIFLRGLDHIILMSEAVGKDKITALLRQVYSRIITLFSFGDIGLFKKLGICQTECLHHIIYALHMCIGITLVLITDVYSTDLDISCCPELISVSCFGNNISKLDISKCPELVETVETSTALSHSYGDNAGIYRMYYYDDPNDMNIYGVHLYIENDTELIW